MVARSSVTPPDSRVRVTRPVMMSAVQGVPLAPVYDAIMDAAACTSLRPMQDAASRLWGPGRRWTPGEIAWALLTATARQDVRLVADGWVWRQESHLAVLASDPAVVMESVREWAPDLPVQVPDGDRALLRALHRVGYREAVAAPFSLDLRLATPDAPDAVLPEGYLIRSARPADDLLGVHRAAWRPADLPFAPGCAPRVDPGATSSLTAAMLAAVQGAWPYRQDLHVVAQAPDGSLAASCITWLDPATGVAAIEPLGVRPEHRRRGLAGALCLHAAHLVDQAGGRELVIHPRGDPAYPAPRGAYLRCGFTPAGRARIYALPAGPRERQAVKDRRLRSVGWA
jgi:predicted N-acetyltransferase YhbS